MSRSYQLGKRAVKQEETRQRIVDATIELHSTLGPARTPASLIAERAGVQRKTFYAHFPDERSLHMACSGTHLERDPLPDLSGWSDIAPGRERLTAGLGAIYQWYERNSGLLACVFRDAEYFPLTAEIIEIRIAPAMREIAAALGEGLGQAGVQMLALAMSFHSWRTLTGEGGADRSTAVRRMVHAIMTADQSEPA